MTPIYADSIGGIGQMLYARDNQRQAASQAALSMLMSALENASRRQQNAQLMAQDQINRDRALRLNEQQMADAVAARNADDAYRSRVFNEYTLPHFQWQKEQAKQPSAADAQRTFTLARDAALRGMFDRSKFNLSPDQATLLDALNQESRAAIDSEYDAQSGLADAMNRRQLLMDYVNLSKEAQADMPRRLRDKPAAKDVLSDAAMFPIAPVRRAWNAIFGTANPQIAYEDSRIKDWTGELGEINRRIAPFEKTQSRMVTIDENGRIVPATPEPAWRAKPAGQAPAAKYPTAFYDEVNRLISTGMAPADAKREAILKFSQ